MVGKPSPATYSKLGMLVLMALERIAREDAEAAATGATS